MTDFIAWHRKHHPLMTGQDAVKLMFQSLCGCGHILADEAVVEQRIIQEEASLEPDISEPLTEPLGAHIRLNLRRAMAEGIEPQWIARMMIVSAKQTPVVSDRRSVFEAVVNKTADAFGIRSSDLQESAQRLLDEPEWIPGHTETYRAAYKPAYRVISQRFEALLPILCALGSKSSIDRLLICIDGACGSGKSTLGNLLGSITDAALIPMDDFFTPHAQKTPERLALPAGNADIERFCNEVMIPWMKREAVTYRPYLCHKDAFGDPVSVPQKRITIVEGSYSLHPSIGNYADLRVFLTIPSQAQMHRIAARNGEEMLETFLNVWIPLEQAYFEAFHLPDEGCFVIQSGMDV